MPVRLLHSTIANDGVIKSLSSKNTGASSLPTFSFTDQTAIFSNCFVKGININVVATLKIVWQNAIPTGLIAEVLNAKWNTASKP